MRTKLMVLATILVAVGCAGIGARQRVVFPTLKKTWPRVKADAVKGLETIEGDAARAIAEQRIEDFDAAMSSEDYRSLTILRPQWPGIRQLVEAGVAQRIEDGEISVGVSVSLLERMERFEEAFLKLTSR